MPELPEVETIVKGLSAPLIGRTIASVSTQHSRVIQSDRSAFQKILEGKTFQSIHRHGKAIFLGLGGGDFLRIHLGMTGQLVFVPENETPTKYTRVAFKLESSGKNLFYNDMRQFGKLSIVRSSQEKGWGPDAWTSSEEILFNALRKKDGMIKHALLNQKILAGLGNIYVDESLFRSGIHPRRPLKKISDGKLRALCRRIKEVLAESIGVGGTSFRNYVDTAGSRGGFKGRLKVYGKNGKPCEICGAPIRKIVVASRGTHYCPKCQRR